MAEKCVKCNDTGGVDCPRCTGTGEGVRDGWSCSLCRGKGRVLCSCVAWAMKEEDYEEDRRRA